MEKLASCSQRLYEQSTQSRAIQHHLRLLRLSPCTLRLSSLLPLSSLHRLSRLPPLRLSSLLLLPLSRPPRQKRVL